TPAELATPDGAPARGVALAPDIMGLRPLFDEHCARLAAENGWAVCAPEPFPGRESTPVEERLDLVRTLNDEQQVGDLISAGRELRGRAEIDRVAVLGFCMGGMYALKSADSGAFDKVVSFYG